MNVIIDQIQDNPNFFEEYNDEIDPIFCNILMDDFVWYENEIHNTVVHTVMEAHIMKLFARANRRSTRTTLSVMHEVLQTTKSICLN